MTSFSFAILTHNEGECIEALLSQLVQYKRDCDEIIVLDDYSDDHITVEILSRYRDAGSISLHHNALNKDFANQKNVLNSLCKGDFIFQIDADELISDKLVSNLETLIEANKSADLFMVPRVNTVDGITPEHIKKWGWRLDDAGRVNFPDYQSRIYRNSPDIKWQNAVHERISGYGYFVYIPPVPALSILHHKSIDRQEKQNSFYETI